MGCIHTAQGLEFDYVSVIIGNKLRYESDKVIIDITERAKTDQSIKGIYKIFQKDFDKILIILDDGTEVLVNGQEKYKKKYDEWENNIYGELSNYHLNK